MLKIIDGIGTFAAGGAAANSQLYLKSWLPVFLDRFSIEDGSSLAASGMVGAHITGITKFEDNSGTKLSILGYALNEKFANKETNESASNITYSRTGWCYACI